MAAQQMATLKSLSRKSRSVDAGMATIANVQAVGHFKPSHCENFGKSWF
jgi:hypothetical protein